MGHFGNIFEVRMKGDGRILSRHYEARDQKQAARKANGHGRILSIRKVHAEDIVGNLESMTLDKITGFKPPETSLMETGTLEGILFPRKSNRRFSDAKRDSKEKERDEN